MISLNDIEQLIANTFFDGNLEVAGIAMFIVMVGITYGIARSGFVALIIGMAVTFMFTLTGVLSTSIAVLMIIISTVALAFVTRSLWKD